MITNDYDYVQWTPDARKLYESNYLKANSPDGRRGLWIKHNILAPEDKRRPAVLELWCVLFDRDQGRPRTLKQMVPMARVMVAKTGLRIESEGILLSDRETRTTLTQQDGQKASWDLTFEPLEGPLLHFPHERMYTAPLPKKKLTTPAPKLRFEGTLSFAGETVSVDDWIGLRGHNWGSEHAFAYAYGNCNLFDDADAVVDMFSAKIKIGPLKTPWMSMAVLRHGGRQLDFNRLRHSLTRHAHIDFPEWCVTIGSADGPLTATWSLDPEECAGLVYLHPDGKVSYCYNSKFAEVKLEHRNEVLTSDQGELEFLFDEPVPGIPLAGHEELPS